METPERQQAREWPTLVGVTAVLQKVTFAFNRSPFVLLVEVPAERAASVIERWLKRYPELLATPQEQTALRKFGHPAPGLIAASSGPQVALFLVVNRPGEEPRFQREQFVDAREGGLVWRHYLLGPHVQRQTWSWWLCADKAAHYRRTVNGLILGAKYGNVEGRARRLEELFRHLNTYPMGGGLREQVFELQRYARRQWRIHRQGRESEVRDLVLPVIPRIPRVKQREVPLSDLAP
ncbi:hypothetical protein V3W47_16550 [Deinococcus sp. YIM 134068]|uniref:hypothetical protein n=1 Tax=Deinococcus lichenicola TaxID=3118910 RepID=UPI002F91CA65